MGDRAAGLLLLVLSTLYGYEARGFVTGFIADPIGPRAFPYLLAAVLFVLSLVLVARRGGEVLRPLRTSWWRFGLVSAGFVLYAAALTPLGFLVSTSLLITLLSVLFGGGLLRGVVFAVSFSAGTYFLFSRLLALSLPAGAVFGSLFSGGV